jgi:hypothetical protein
MEWNSGKCTRKSHQRQTLLAACLGFDSWMPFRMDTAYFLSEGLRRALHTGSR